jgi:RNase P/RNase MRP subunit p29
MHDLAQRYSNLNKDKSDISRNAYRIKRSIETENENEETSQTLAMHDIHRLLEKEINGTAGKIKKDTQNMLSLREEKIEKEIEKINEQVIQMESEVKDISIQVEKVQLEVQERIQGSEQNIHQIGHDSSNTQRTNKKMIQRVEDLRIKAEQAADEAQESIKKIEEIKQQVPQAAASVFEDTRERLKIVQSDNNSTEIEVEGKGVIAKFSKAGYYFRGGQLHIHNPETGIDVAIPSEFNFLKAVKNPEKPAHYMLVITNQLGNELFEYKKYDPTFAFLPGEFKSLDSQQIKSPEKISLNNGLYFILKPGDIELGNSQDYIVNVYEIGSNKKIGTLIDEFCYYQGGQFNYTNYHAGSEIHHSSSHDHYLSLDQKENYQAEAGIICGETNEKIAYDVNPIVTSEFGLLEYLADHLLVS